MSDGVYSFVHTIGYPAFWVSARPFLLHRNRLPKRGGLILAPTHLSNFDVPVLIADTPRNIDFMSVVEFEKAFFVGRLFHGMNCFFLDRGRVDPKTVRVAVERLKAGRMIGMFPEGKIRAWNDSVIHGRPFKPGVARIAQMADAPVLPCVVLGTDAYYKVRNWLPHKQVRYGINYGRPLAPRTDLDPAAAQADLGERLSAAYQSLYKELRAKFPAGLLPPDPPAE